MVEARAERERPPDPERGLGVAPGRWLAFTQLAVLALLLVTVWNRCARALREAVA